MIDDSIHAMIERERRHAEKRGTPTLSYRPRVPHPLLEQSNCAAVITAQEEDAPTVAVSEDHCSEHSFPEAAPHEQRPRQHNNRKQAEEDDDAIDRLLFHTKHHCDTVDALDLPRSGQRVLAGVVR